LRKPGAWISTRPGGKLLGLVIPGREAPLTSAYFADPKQILSWIPKWVPKRM